MLLTTNRHKQDEYLEEFTATHIMNKKSSKCNDSLIHYALTLGFLVSILSTILLSMQAGTSAELLIASTTTRFHDMAISYLPTIMVGHQGDLDEPILFLHESATDAILKSSAETTRKRKEKGVYDERIETLQQYMELIYRIQTDLHTTSHILMSNINSQSFMQHAKNNIEMMLGQIQGRWASLFQIGQDIAPVYQKQLNHLENGDPIALLTAYNAPDTVAITVRTILNSYDTEFQAGRYGATVRFKNSQIEVLMPNVFIFEREFYSIDSVLRPMTVDFPSVLQDYILVYMKQIYMTYQRRASERSLTILKGNNDYQKIAKELEEEQDVISLIVTGLREFSLECIRGKGSYPKHPGCAVASRLEADLPKSLNRILKHGLSLPNDLLKYVLHDLRRNSVTRYTPRELLRLKYLDDIRRAPNLAVQLGFIGVGVALIASLIGVGYGLSYVVNTGVLQVAMRLAAAAEHTAARIEEKAKGERVLQIMRMRFEAEKVADLNSRSKPLPLVAE